MFSCKVGRCCSALLGTLVFFLQACGGGGGGAPETQTPVVVPAPAVSIGGTASGIVGPGLVLQLNGGSDLAVDLSRDFTFASAVAVGTAYQVTIKSNPVGQVCVIAANGTGIATTAVSNIQVNCTTPVPPGSDAFRLGGTVSGLTGTGLTLRSGTQDVQIAPLSTQFSFPQPLSTGTSYAVTVATQPSSQNCVISSGMGTIASADVTNVVVTCVTDAPAPTVGLTVDKAELFFAGEEGQTVAAQTLFGSIAGVTDPVFMRIAFSDTGLLFASFTRTSATGGQLLVSPRQPDNLAPATYRDTITVDACYDTACTRPLPGSPRVVDVTYVVKPPMPAPILKLSDRGVAFASTPGGSRLSHTLTVLDTSGAASAWTASTDAQWLGVTASGISGGALVLTANPSGLSNGFRMATVTVASGNDMLNPQTVRVGLYVNDATPAASLVDPLPNDIEQIVETAQVTDPVRPLVYSAAGASIAVHHVYSGERIATLPVAGANLGGVVVNDDGTRLYALNYANGQIVVVDLDALAVSHSYGFPQFTMSGDVLLANRVAFARVMGHPVLMLTNAMRPGDGGTAHLVPVFKADSGELLGSLQATPWPYLRLAVSRDGTTAYAADAGLSGVLSITRIDLRANSLGNVYGRAVGMTTGVNVSNLQDIATSPDGSRVYVSYSTVLEAVWDGGALSWTGGLEDFHQPSSNLEVDATGRLFMNNRGYDLRIYSAQRTLEHQWLDIADQVLVSGKEGSMRVSGDGMRLIGNWRLMGIAPP